MPSRDALPAENTCACFAEALSLEDLAFVMPLIERRVMYPGPSADEAYQTFLHEHLTQQRGPDDSYDDMLDRLTRVENQISSACSPSGGRFDLHD
ncbi:hypothetical protein [Terricaulis sp.]|uniref:hypothetical protein n=1 Tax=Terricaulis sp. TaxID=2768686 RepID=UPI003784EEEF